VVHMCPPKAALLRSSECRAHRRTSSSTKAEDDDS
jgi:hypothetical protein